MLKMQVEKGGLRIVIRREEAVSDDELRRSFLGSQRPGRPTARRRHSELDVYIKNLPPMPKDIQESRMEAKYRWIFDQLRKTTLLKLLGYSPKSITTLHSWRSDISNPPADVCGWLGELFKCSPEVFESTPGKVVAHE